MNAVAARPRSNRDASRVRITGTNPTAHQAIPEPRETMRGASNVGGIGSRDGIVKRLLNWKMVSVICGEMAVPKLSKSTGAFESPMITVRDPASIHQVDVPSDGGACHVGCPFSFDRYFDPRWMRLGTRRVFYDDTLTPLAVWPLALRREA